jgi:uncharacterized protein
MLRKTLFFSFTGAFFTCALLSASPHYPSYQGYVTDSANILDAPSRAALERQLTAFEQSTSIEIAVATVSSLEDDTVEMYAN